jgi:tetratricopeptide (TPR) repeat protein
MANSTQEASRIEAQALHALARPTEALEAYERIMESAPQEAEPYLEYATLLEESAKHARETEILNLGLQKTGGDSRLLAPLGLALERVGQNSEAIPHLERAASLSPGDHAILFGLGSAYMQTHQNELALQRLREAAQIKPTDAMTLRLLGGASEACQLPDDALAYYRKALAIDASDMESRGGLGRMLAETGELGIAVRELEAALQARPGEPELSGALGSVFVKLGRDQEALAPLEAALGTSSTRAAALNNLAEALRRIGRLDDAIQRGQEAIAESPEDPSAHLALGLSLSAAAQPQRAETHLSRANSLGSKQASRELGLLLFGQGDYGKAEPLLKAALDRSPQDLSLKSTWGRTLCALKRFEEAAEVLTGSESPEGRFDRARALREIGQLGPARDVARTVEATGDLGAATQALLGEILEELGDDTGARGAYQKSVEFDHAGYAGWAGLGRCAARLGEHAAAAEAFRKACSIDPSSISAVRGLASAQDELPDLDARAQTWHHLAEADSADVETWSRLAAAETARHRWEDVERACTQGLRIDTNRGDLHLSLASALEKMGRLEDALTSFKACLQQSPSEGAAAWGAARSLTGLSRQSEALPYYSNAASALPEETDLHMEWAQQLLLADRFADAKQAVAPLCEQSPKDPEAHRVFGHSLAGLSDWSGAKDALVIATKTGQVSSATWLLLGQSLTQLQDISGAEHALQRARELAPSDATIQLSVARLLQECGSYNDALQSYMSATSLAPGDHERAAEMGACALLAEDWHIALGAYQVASGAPNATAEMFVGLGRALAKLHRWTDSAAAFKRASGRAPTDGAIGAEWASSLESGEQFEEAVLAWRHTVSAAPDNIEFKRLLGQAQARVSAWQEAEQTLRAAAQGAPLDAPSLFQLGRCYSALKQEEEALTHLYAALALDPDLRPAREALVDSLYGASSFVDAITELDTLARTKPLEPHQALLKVRCLRANSEPAAAILELDRVQHADATVLTILRAEILVDLDKAAEAVPLATQATENAPTSLDAWMALGRAREAVSELPGALDAYRLAHGLAPDELAPSLAVGGVQRSAASWLDASDTYEALLGLHPESPEAHLGQALTFKGLNRVHRMRQSLEAALELDPKHVESLCAAAEAREEAGDIDEAFALWRRAVISDVANAEALSGLRALAESRDRPEEVVRALQEALDNGGGDWEHRLSLGEALLRAEAFIPALEVLRAVLAERSDQVPVVRLVARAELGAGELQAAITRFEKLTSHSEVSPTDWLCLAECYDDLGDVGRADAAVAEARSLAPRSIPTLRSVAARATRMGSHPTAIRLYQELLRLTPNDEQASWSLAEALYKSSDFKGALAILAPRVEGSPQDLAALGLLGKCQKRLGQLEEAVETFGRIGRESQDANALHEQGVLLQKLKRYDESAAALKAALNQEPKRAMTHYALGATLIHQGRPSEAVKCWHDAAHDAPDNVDLRAALAWGLLMTKDPEEAATHSQKALELGLSDPGMLRNLGRGFEKLGRAADALPVYQQLVQKEPSDAAALISLAACLENLDKADEAIEVYQRGILANSRNPELRLALGKAYAERGETRAARSQYERLRNLDADKAALLLRVIEG